jgi:uncharacterized protein YprB with RNaseH-like and TPR domain
MTSLRDRLAQTHIGGRDCDATVGAPGHEHRSTLLTAERARSGVTASGDSTPATRGREAVAAALQQIVGSTAGRSISRETPAVFLDIETTGLARGQGTLAFVVGVAHHVGDDLCVEQWVLRATEAEPAMLEDVAARVQQIRRSHTALVTYNGASFDLPLLKARLGRARLACDALGPLHVDLLHPTRRLWRGVLRDCRLATLELDVLGLARTDDISATEIPAVFDRVIEAPRDESALHALEHVCAHNLTDVVVLPVLAAHIGRMLAYPADPCVALRAARHFVAAGDVEAALARLEPWIERAHTGAGTGVDDDTREAALVAAALLRRLGRHDRARAVWTWLCEALPGDPDAHDALAKHLEHRMGDLDGALHAALGSRSPCPRRVARLGRKLLVRERSHCKSGSWAPFGR